MCVAGRSYKFGDIEKYKILMDIPLIARSYAFKHAQPGRAQYLTVLRGLGDDLMFRTFAYKKNGNEILLNEVERKTLNNKMALRKDITFSALAGYTPVFKKMNKYNSWYQTFCEEDFGRWFVEYPIGVYTKIINLDYLFNIDEFKYCGYKSGCGDLYEYLKLYESDKSVEYFGKLGVFPYKSLLNLAKKDKQFVRWLIEADKTNINICGPAAIIRAYRENTTAQEARRRSEEDVRLKKEFRSMTEKLSIKMLYKVNDYIQNNGIERVEYMDYYEACKGLGLDMDNTKNMFPKEFRRMHDLRTSEYESKKAKEREESLRVLNEGIAAAACKWSGYVPESDLYTIIIPVCSDQFVEEGKALNHCVGRMGYDKKMSEGKDIIAFIRKKGEEDKAYVTAEYTFCDRRVNQCYALHDSMPEKDVLEFAEQWGAMITKKVKEEKRLEEENKKMAQNA